MEKKFQKNRYYGLKYERANGQINDWVVLGEDFETLAKFKEYCNENDLLQHFCPLNVASTMIGSRYRIVKPSIPHP